MIKTSFFFASDISDLARPISIDGSRELIARSHHREAMFWVVAAYSRCQKVLHHDAPAQMQEWFGRGYRHLLNDFGITSSADPWRRIEQVEASLAEVWEVAVAIMAANWSIDGR